MTVAGIIANSFLFVTSGAFAGLMAGMLGIGGGMVVVPALAFIFKHNTSMSADLTMHMAAGTSLAVMIFTAQSSVRTHYHHGTIQWKIFHRLAPGIVLGTIAGAIIADSLPTHVIRMLFGIFLLLVVIRMSVTVEPRKKRGPPTRMTDAVVSVIVGIKSGLLGVGGGALIIPYMTYCRVNLRQIAGISSLCTLTVAIVGSISFMVTGSKEAGLPHYSIGYVNIPAALLVAIPSTLFAAIGARLSYRLPLKQLKRGFVVVLLVAAFHLLL